MFFIFYFFIYFFGIFNCTSFPGLVIHNSLLFVMVLDKIQFDVSLRGMVLGLFSEF